MTLGKFPSSIWPSVFSSVKQGGGAAYFIVNMGIKSVCAPQPLSNLCWARSRKVLPWQCRSDTYQRLEPCLGAVSIQEVGIHKYISARGICTRGSWVPANSAGKARSWLFPQREVTFHGPAAQHKGKMNTKGALFVYKKV